MPRVRLKIHAWLIRDHESDASSFKESFLCVSENESLYQILSRLTVESGAFRGAIFAEKTAVIREDILIVLNGRIVRPSEFSSMKIQDDDEISFLPLLAGG